MICTDLTPALPAQCAEGQITRGTQIRRRVETHQQQRQQQQQAGTGYHPHRPCPEYFISQPRPQPKLPPSVRLRSQPRVLNQTKLIESNLSLTN